MTQQISPGEVLRRLRDEGREKPLLLDVREPWEFDYCHIEGSMLLPMNDVPRRMDELRKDAEIVVICHHGIRSYRIARLLEHHGFSRVYNLQGGVDRWAREADPAMRKY